MTALAPANCTDTCFEFEFRTSEAISNDGENSTVAIWNEPVTSTGVWSAATVSIARGAAAKFETVANRATVNEGEPRRLGRCC